MITATQQTVSIVLGDGYLHEIPPYQRPYAWRDDESLQLFEDLRDAAAVQDGNEPYFLGSIVLIKRAGEINGQVVDGQQRLTTLTILAAVLRDIAVDNQEIIALGNAVYIHPNPYLNQMEAVRIKAHREDEVFFRNAIQTPGATVLDNPPDPPQTHAQTLMWENAQRLRERALEMPVEERQQFVTFLLNSCVIVVVSTESRSAALRIFRVLNDRGLDLSNADVIKADLLERFHDPQELAHQAHRWRALEADLGRDEFEGLLETLRFVQERTKNRRTLSEAYAQRFEGQNVVAVRAFFDNELSPAKIWIARMSDRDVGVFPIEFRRRAFEALEGLSLIPNKDWLPAAIYAAMQYGPTLGCVDVWERLEALAWTFQLGRRYDTQRMNRFAEVINAINAGHEMLHAALAASPQENEDASRALRGPLYSSFPVRVVRAILERLDRLLAEQPVVWDGQKTVEHILPQHPGEGWDQFPNELRHGATHTLGNLVLLTRRKNSGASNLPYAQKRAVYFGLGGAGGQFPTYASVQELALVNDWTPAEYAARHEHHCTLLRNRWGLIDVA